MRALFKRNEILLLVRADDREVADQLTGGFLAGNIAEALWLPVMNFPLSLLLLSYSLTMMLDSTVTKPIL